MQLIVFIFTKKKNKNIFLLCYALEPQIGGLAKAVLTRSKKLSELGYKVTILTVDFGQNYEFVIKKLCESGYLDDKVDIVNLFDYYRNKNEVGSNDLLFYFRAIKVTSIPERY